jgi:hypothetical protein
MTGVSFKSAAGRLVAMAPQCDPSRAVFVIGHMRCGSTALSNVLVSRPEFSGYGEAHVGYGSRAALGVLLLNQWRRRSWRPRAVHLFDKILHSRYDAAAWPGFFTARAIFVARAPEAAIPSIRALFAAIDSAEYGSDAEAAAYYAERLETMLALWPRFAPGRRLALTYEALTAAPETELARVGAMLGLSPPLTNAYAPPAAAQARGAGDPLMSHRFARIDAGASGQGAKRSRAPLDIQPKVRDRLAELYSTYRSLAENHELHRQGA